MENKDSLQSDVRIRVHELVVHIIKAFIAIFLQTVLTVAKQTVKN